MNMYTCICLQSFEHSGLYSYILERAQRCPPTACYCANDAREEDPFVWNCFYADDSTLGALISICGSRSL